MRFDISIHVGYREMSQAVNKYLDTLVYTKDLRKDVPILLVPVFMTMCL